jgi:protein gp37
MMGAKSKIEWTDASWNPIRARDKATGKIGWYCKPVSEACRYCYSERQNLRGMTPAGNGLPFKPGIRDDIDIFLDEEMLLAPLHWKRPRKIFVCSMTDLFADFVPDEMIDKMFAVMALCPQHIFQVLTKRPERAREYLADAAVHSFGGPDTCSRIAAECNRHRDVAFAENVTPASIRHRWPLPNLWLGTSCEDQATADERIPDLLATPAPVRFISAEPLLGHISLNFVGDLYGKTIDALFAGVAHIAGDYGERRPVPSDHPALDLVIGGGESGLHARGTLRSSFLSLRDQCDAAGVAYFHKQNGEWIDADEWFDMIQRGPSQIIRSPDWASPGKPARPLNFEDAALLAKSCGRRYEHQSDGSTLIRVGKHAAGRLLDGIEHNAFPQVRG